MDTQRLTFKQFAGLTILSATVAGLLAAAHAAMTPMPISAATTALGGLVAVWILRRATRRSMSIGAGIGALAGGAMHAYAHLVEGRLHPDEGLMAHIAGDVALGTAIGILALVLPFAIARLVRRSATQS